MAIQYKPILFSTEMVKAILEGRKIQTRRIIKKKYSNTDLVIKKDKYGERLIERQNDAPPPRQNEDGTTTHHLIAFAEINSKYKIGDILWIRETFFNCSSFKEYPLFSEIKGNFCYKTNDFIGCHKWKPSIHMPKEAARIFLEVTNVRVERLQDISEEDAIAEGIDKKGDLYFNYFESKLLGIGLQKEYFYKEIPKVSFMSLWSKINGIDSWKANPWVWVYEFKVVEKPKDFIYEN